MRATHKRQGKNFSTVYQQYHSHGFTLKDTGHHIPIVQIVRMLAERLPPRLENHLYAFISCFAASPPDETAFTASSDPGNADRVDPARLPSGMRSFLGHVNTYGSAPLKQTTDLAYQSAEIAIQGYEVDEGQISANRPAQIGAFVR